MNKTFKTHILVSLMLILAMVGVGIYFVVSMETAKLTDTYQGQLYGERLDGIIAALEQHAEKLDRTGLQEAYQDSFEELAIRNFQSMYGDHDMRPYILDTDGHELLWEAESLDGELGAGIVTNSQRRFEYIDLNAGAAWVVGRNFVPWDWTVVYVVPHREKYAQADQLGTQLALAIVFVFLAAFLLIYIVVARLTRPVTQLTEASQAMAKGDLSYRLPEKTDGELKILTDSFSRMRDSIRSQLQSLEQENRDRQAAEKALLQREEDLRITLNSIGEAVITASSTGYITRMNPVAEKLTGWSSEEAGGALLTDVFRLVENMRSDTPVKGFLETALAADAVVTISDEAVLKAKDGCLYRIRASVAPIRNAASDVVGVVLVCRDVTADYQLQEQLQHSRKMDAIGQLAGGVAHDFNNMLGGILGAAQILEMSEKESDDKDMIDLIISTVKRAAELTKNLLAFGQKGGVESTPVDLHKAISGAVDIMERSVDKRVRITRDLSAEESIVVGDLSLLQNMVLNLGINASHAMPEGGELTVTTSVTYLDDADCVSTPFELKPGAYIELKVGDTGTGIAPDVLEHIFHPFFTTKELGKGTGLGLSTSYGTVQQHGGSISVRSEEGVGTEFTICLPLLERGLQVEESLQEQIIPGSGFVLVIDDEEVIRVMAESILKRLGYTVLLATNGAVGVKLFEERKDEIDVVLMDMVMPEMDGRECFVHLKELDPEVRVILSSGFSRRSDEEEMCRNGLKGQIRKPYSAAELSHVLHDALQ